MGRAEPEGRDLADALEVRAALSRGARVPRREVVRLEHVMARLRGEEADQVGQRDESFLGPWQERWPASRVLFRPEEIHARSEERRAPAGRTEAEVDVPEHPAGSPRVMPLSRISRVT